MKSNVIVGPWGAKTQAPTRSNVTASEHYDAHWHTLSLKMQELSFERERNIDQLALWLDVDGTVRVQNRAHAVRLWSAMGQRLGVDVPLDGLPVLISAPNGEVTICLAVGCRVPGGRQFQADARRAVKTYADDLRSAVTSFCGPPVGHIALDDLGLWLRVDKLGREHRAISGTNLHHLRWHCESIRVDLPVLPVGQVPVLVLLGGNRAVVVPFTTDPRAPSPAPLPPSA